MTQIVKGTENDYKIVRQVAKATDYQLYLCKQEGTERQYLLQIASATEQNGGLQKFAYILEELKNRADDLEKEYEKVKKDDRIFLNYNFGFPELVDSFVSPEQGDRWINIFAFKNVDKVNQMVPLSNLREKDSQRIDLRTSAWIMGKLLKMLVFAHNQGILVNMLTRNNILIQPKEHYVVIFDWHLSTINPEMIPREERCAEISKAAQSVVAALGGNLETGEIPDSDDETKLYACYLLGLARGEESDAQRAHSDFYKIVDSLWRREYYPFTTKPF